MPKIKKISVPVLVYKLNDKLMGALEASIDKTFLDALCSGENEITLSFRVGNYFYKTLHSNDYGELYVDYEYTDPEDGTLYEEQDDLFSLPLSEKLIIYKQVIS